MTSMTQDRSELRAVKTAAGMARRALHLADALDAWDIKPSHLQVSTFYLSTPDADGNGEFIRADDGVEVQVSGVEFMTLRRNLELPNIRADRGGNAYLTGVWDGVAVLVYANAEAVATVAGEWIYAGVSS